MSSSTARISSGMFSILKVPSGPTRTPPSCCMSVGGEISMAYQYCCSRETPLTLWTVGRTGVLSLTLDLAILALSRSSLKKPDVLAVLVDFESLASSLGKSCSHFAIAARAHVCSFTCCIVIRLLGSTTSSREIISLASSETFCHRSSGLNENFPFTTCFKSRSTSFARNGIILESMTYRSTPRLHKSHALPYGCSVGATSPKPVTTSGATYCGVPTSPVSPSSCVHGEAPPKSMSLICGEPFATNTRFSAFKSRCTTPTECM
mmetsp:Transcript_17303/g.37153  ORF Transcript_17303/g.37153 Transcript_17303/m.37153 type:complete len:263 (-) Transcript_17303:282-1070(-)